MKSHVNINVAVGDIVQIATHHKWNACLAIVSEIKAWGVQAFVRIPSNSGDAPANAYIRLEWADFLIVGCRAPVLPSELAEDVAAVDAADAL